MKTVNNGTLILLLILAAIVKVINHEIPPTANTLLAAGFDHLADRGVGLHVFYIDRSCNYQIHCFHFTKSSFVTEGYAEP